MLGRLVQWEPARRLARRAAGATALNHLVRMVPVADLVHGSAGSTVLDVGSGSQGIAQLLDEGWSVTAVDASFDDYGAARGPAAGFRAVVGDVRALEFRDGAFDVVVAVDLLEHVAPADRPRAIAELRRVARRRVVVACPAGDAALDADRRLASALADPPGWLDEHLANGFPSERELAETLGGNLEGNESIAAHERLVRRELSPLWFVPTRAAAIVVGWAYRRGGRPRAWAQRVLRKVRGGDAPPTYRTIVCLDVSVRGAEASAGGSGSPGA